MTKHAGNTTEMAMELGWAMSEMKSCLRQKIQEKINGYDPDLSFELLEIIGLLWRSDGMNQQDIGRIVSKDKSSITYLISCLVERGLAKRITGKKDKRNKQVFLTEKGRQKREMIFPLALAVYQRAVGTIKEKEMQQALALVKKMIINLE
ncbi:MAG: winged helix DNA-binding protein [Niabella sp.]|nr:winged helix DNA-binding protein [Niabella sp.]